jgi:hypothetical protein
MNELRSAWERVPRGREDYWICIDIGLSFRDHSRHYFVFGMYHLYKAWHNIVQQLSRTKIRKWKWRGIRKRKDRLPWKKILYISSLFA